MHKVWAISFDEAARKTFSHLPEEIKQRVVDYLETRVLKIPELLDKHSPAL